MVVMLVIFSIHAYWGIRTTSSNLTSTVNESALRASDLIVRSTRYSMLLDRKEDVHQTIRTLGTEPGFVGIRVYNREGLTVFSTDSLTIGQQIDRAAEACNVCHLSGEPLDSVATADRMRIYRDDGGERILALITPIRNEPACSNAACHAHSADQRVLGVLDVRMSLAGVDARVAAVRREMTLSSLVAALIVAGLSGLFIYRVVRRPIRRIRRAMATVAGGNLEATVEASSNDELGDLAVSFNRMAADLKDARFELQDWADNLEERVRKQTDEVRRVQTQVLQMEKMASLGKLSAGVAHEINNPLFGILTYAKLGLRELDEPHADTEKLREYLSVVRKESGRCGEIVRSLLDFASPRGGRFEASQLTPLVEEVMLLLAHHFELQNVTVQRDFQLFRDRLVCDPRQILQALIAPCINAVEAMPEGGELTIRTSGTDDSVQVEISDNGEGISQEVLGQVFEPFYTTKADQGGLGLGLAVVYGIVQRHGGRVDVASTPGEGTKLTIVLPRKPETKMDDVDDADEPHWGDTREG